MAELLGVWAEPLHEPPASVATPAELPELEVASHFPICLPQQLVLENSAHAKNATYTEKVQMFKVRGHL